LTLFSIPFRNSTGTIYNCLRLSSLEEGRGSLAERLLDLDPTEFKDSLCSYAELLCRTKRKKWSKKDRSLATIGSASSDSTYSVHQAFPALPNKVINSWTVFCRATRPAVRTSLCRPDPTTS
jgi:hypothetical protein